MRKLLEFDEGQEYYKLFFSLAVPDSLLCASDSSTFILHFGTQEHCGHAVGLRQDPPCNYLVYDSNQDFVLRISDELLYDLVVQWTSPPRQCLILAVCEQDDDEDVVVTQDDVLDIKAGAPLERCARDINEYDLVVTSIIGAEGKDDGTRDIAYSSEHRRLGIAVLQEFVETKRAASDCNHLHIGLQFSNVCLAVALHHHGQTLSG